MSASGYKQTCGEVRQNVPDPGDVVTGALLSAVAHVLTHVRSTGKDRTRLEKVTGCCVPAAEPEPNQLSCCGGTASS